MRIAIFYNLNFGGAKRVVMEHAKGLNKKGYLVDLYTVNLEKDIFDPSPFCENIYNYDIKINSSSSLLKRLQNDYTNFFKLKSLHKKIAGEIDNRFYDLVLVHPDKLTQAPFLLRFLKTRSAYYCQEPLRIVYEYSMRFKKNVNFLKRAYEETTRLYRRKIDRENVRAATFTIASCYYVRERMIESYEVFPKVVYCAVDDSIFRPLKIKKINQIFFVGSANVFEDGYDLAYKALNMVPKQIRPKLRVVSWRKADGARLSEDELATIYNQSIATLCTSRLETFGLVPLESMSCSTPVIATNVSGHRETIIDNKTGFLVDFDARDIAKKIIFLINNPKEAEKLGSAARKHIEKNWNWKKRIDDLDTVLLNFIKSA